MLTVAVMFAVGCTNPKNPNGDNNAVECCGTYNGHAYVDLGLPSGTLWATCNIGADTPEDYGDYFAWGETQPKNYYDWSSYQYCMGRTNKLTRYCNRSNRGYNGFTDNLTILQFGDDAATMNWGHDWRTPTRGLWEELVDNTTSKWITRNDVFGRVFYGNGQSLFLPAAGYRWYDEIDSVGYYVGYSGYYWSSSLNANSSDRAWYFHINAGNYYMGTNERYYGQFVRAVRSARQN